MSIYDDDEFTNYLSGANQGAYNLGDLGELGINTDFLTDSFILANMPAGSGLFDIEGNLNLENTLSLVNDPVLFTEFAKFRPDEAAILKDMMGGDYGFAPVGGGSPADAASGVYDPNDQSAAETARLQRQANATLEGDKTGIKSGVPIGDPNDPTGIKKLTEISGGTSGIKSLKDAVDSLKKQFEELTGVNAGDAAKAAAILAAAKMAKEDAEAARKEARGAVATGTGEIYTGKGRFSPVKKAAQGGVMSLGMAQGRYLGGHSDGMADRVPASIEGKRPAALSDGEFVIPADVVSHLGNGNSNAGAKRLYEMMDRIRGARTGNTKQGKQINPNKFMPR